MVCLVKDGGGNEHAICHPLLEFKGNTWQDLLDTQKSSAVILTIDDLDINRSMDGIDFMPLDSIRVVRAERSDRIGRSAASWVRENYTHTLARLKCNIDMFNRFK